MTVSSMMRHLFLVGIGVAAFTLATPPPAGAAECMSRGDLDVRFCDDDGDLVEVRAEEGSR